MATSGWARLLRVGVASFCVVVAAGRVEAASTGPVIQPGSRLAIGGDGCTADWVYAGQGPLRGQQFLGTARHCVTKVGEPVYLSAGPFPVSLAPGSRVGAVAYISKTLDYALVRIDRGNFRYVTPSMAGHPDIPARVAGPADAHLGDICQFSGHGVGFDGTSETEQDRAGLLTDVTQTQFYCAGPASNGDSGGPVADTTDGNAALGILDALDASVGGSSADAGVQGVTVTALLADAAHHGFPVRVRTVG